MDYGLYTHVMKVVQIDNYFDCLNTPKVKTQYWIHPFHKTQEEDGRCVNSIIIKLKITILHIFLFLCYIHNSVIYVLQYNLIIDIKYFDINNHTLL